MELLVIMKTKMLKPSTEHNYSIISLFQLIQIADLIQIKSLILASRIWEK